MVTDGHGPRTNGVPLFPGVIRGSKILWVTKTRTSGDAQKIWREAKELLKPITIEKNEVDRLIVVHGGGELWVRPGEEYDSLRGPAWGGVVIDESAYVELTEIYDKVVLPTLAVHKGWFAALGSPNYKKIGQRFNRLYDQATGPEWARFTGATADNPLVPPEAIEEARRLCLPVVFRQEWLGQAVSVEGARYKEAWFRYFREENVEPGAPGERTGTFLLGTPDGDKRVPVALGERFGTADPAASEKTAADHMVIGAHHLTQDRDLLLLDVERGHMPGPDQVPALRRMIERWGLGYMGVEKTGYQLTLIQNALHQGLPVRPLEADRDKVSRSMVLETLMQAGKVYFRSNAPYLLELEAELLAFTGEPKDQDDQVDMLSYAAIHASHQRVPTVGRFSIKMPSRAMPGARGPGIAPMRPPPAGVGIA